MTRWEIAFRLAVVVLLAVIALQLGGWSWILSAASSAYHSVRGGKEELPAPGSQGGLWNAYGQPDDAVRPAPGASATR